MKKIALLFVFLLASCGDSSNNGAGIQGTVNRLEKEITITVTTVKNEKELSKLYSDLTGVSTSRVPDQYGFAQWNERVDGSDPESYNCQIYIIEPKRADDQQILTLGHEMAHCLWGSYHR
jgi:Zn-dependent peptidase ImmA (M78 family)